MEIYLDANATTPVLLQAREAAMAAMAEDFGNPSSIHSTGLKARALMDGVRARARRVLGASTGKLLFLSGATEGIQTAVLSALSALRDAPTRPELLLYGATEHKAVPEAIKHWNALLGLNLKVLAIPVGRDGRHDLAWLREHAPRAGLVCTMAANNETGVITDLDGIEQALSGSTALWMVDGVQALGKLPLRLAERRIDYAPFSGHKLYAPKGIGLLYVREGAPFTPLLAGGGQEGALRSGTENMSGIAALGAVLAALGEGQNFRDPATLVAFRDRLAAALQQAFPGLVFNAPPELCLPTTLNFAVPGISSKLLLDLFDAAELRVSGGSACSAAKAQPSYVLEAMGLPAWQTASAVRLSFGPVADAAFIDEACARIRICGESLRESCLDPSTPGQALPADGLTRFVVDGACCYLLADAASRRAVVVDPLPELTERLAQWLNCQGYELAAVLDTHSHGDHASSAPELLAAAKQRRGAVDGLGWPLDADAIELGALKLSRMAIPGHTQDSTAYLLHDEAGLRLAFVGDTVMPGALGRSDFEQSAPLDYGASLGRLEQAVGPHTLLLPGHDYDDRFASTLAVECVAQPLLADVLAGRVDAAGFAAAKAELEQGLALTEYQTVACGARVDGACPLASSEMSMHELNELLHEQPQLLLVDVREPYEQRLGQAPELGVAVRREAVALSGLPNALARWLTLPAETPVVFFCRSGNRSAQAAQALRRLGHEQAWSLGGGLALWPRALAAGADAALAI
ncbi:cysteine sulfinate desulfinase/cysteine desulfurase-like protein/glyoxylase-like metal-dependent hydrolase (beta-lactamase superfamily II)/rhodanese-related sulfurtransferase [Pelomonas saccharophila]|uniref:cysteine desulfurase n=1 Tax=Roseateles saccharophilus TaxID=304 RepID=A0ABU1YFT9_ROSSA|nr:aminotransferase class V-fold PLP-dependent enzyme [Roseateles saccharophilus]MDR7267723.1 cysteine sulfinate desulfinase/cysteine desulfurase-like protein/glyoxylase-like metal-dependent hydrolase (beta-lactamase superfamily II)/rhodanese-related sulfurtransferase [Roseateles saccharophilus]